MKIEKIEMTVGKVCNNYVNNKELGVVGYGGLLNIRPKYEREYSYTTDRRNDVIKTIIKNYPLSTMYWSKVKHRNAPDGYALIDGQRRTIAICEYVANKYSVDCHRFNDLPEDIKNRILDYPLDVYVFDGTDSEKLEWLRTINIATPMMDDQEILNLVYDGKWMDCAKEYFCKHNCPAYKLGKAYIKGSPILQSYLKLALEWIADLKNMTIDEYMANHKDKDDEFAIELIEYYNSVIEWVKATFPHKRKEMLGLPWGIYYNKYHNRTDLDPKKLEDQISKLIFNSEIGNREKIYEYVLSEDWRVLDLKKFDRHTISKTYDKQNHACAVCGEPVPLNQLCEDYIVPWSKGGKATANNCRLVCGNCLFLETEKTNQNTKLVKPTESIV